MERGRRIVKLLARVLTVFSLLIGCFGWLGFAPQAHAIDLRSTMFNQSTPILGVEIARLRNRADAKLPDVYGDKIDLNNTNVRAFQQYPGFYPTLARKVILNAPYENVEDVLDISGLSNRQKQLLQSHLDDFTVTKSEAIFNEGADRFNNGIYR